MINRTAAYPQDSVLNAALNTIERYGMLSGRDRVLVALSGGPDSVALLHILRTLAPTFGLKLAAAHLNHGLRPRTSERDERWVNQMAKRLAIPCHTETVHIQRSAAGSLEERARKARYDFFDRLAQQYGYTRIAIGHQANDNAEAVLLHLLRGSGMRGLGGIPPVRGNRIIRPLIHVQRSAIIAYLDQRNIRYVNDESNQDMAFDRNRIRHQLIPLLEKQFNPNIVATLHRTADLCHEEEKWLQNELKPWINRTITEHTESCLKLRTDELCNAPLALQRRVIRDAMRSWRGHLKRITADHIDAIVELLREKRVGKGLTLPFLVAVERTADHLAFTIKTKKTRGQQKQKCHFRYTIETPDALPKTIQIPVAGVSLVICQENPRHWAGQPRDDIKSAWFDLNQLSFPLVIRNVMPGDRMTPYGMKGTQKLKKLFIDRKIPRNRRGLVPILLSADTICWVAGIRRSDAAPIVRATTHAVVVRVQALDEGG